MLEQLDPKSGQTIVDASFGAGGHARELLERVNPADARTVNGGRKSPAGRVIGLDRDAGAIKAGRQTFSADIDAGRLVLVHAKFSELQTVLTELKVHDIDGLLFDAGVSSMQIVSSERGFSFSGSGPLDMRMDTRESLTAARILAEWSEDKLRSQFFLVDEPAAGRIARAIVGARKEVPIQTTDQLVEIIKGAVIPRFRAAKINPATRVFLALRIAVNHELEELRNGMLAGLQVLKPGGRMAVISFHSTEDRVVKQTMQEWARGCICPPELPVCRCQHIPEVKLINKKPITPTAQENATNPRARSAKLRVCIKI